MINENLKLSDKDISYARRLCASIDDRNIRNRAVANNVGVILAESYFDPEVCQVDSASGLHNVASIVENYEISDIYVNNSYIDVRVYFSRDEICIPKVHFDTGILPSLYMFIMLSSDLSSAEVRGFVRPERIDKTKVADDVYYLSENDFENYYDVESKLMDPAPQTDIDETKIFDFLEGSLSDEEVISFLRELVNSKVSRQKLIKCVNAQSVFNFISVADNIDDSLYANQADGTDNDGKLSENDLEELFAEEDSAGDGEEVEYSTSITPSGADVIESLDNESKIPEDNNSEQIEVLFTGEQEGIPVEKPKKKSSGMTLVLLSVLLIAAVGYYFYVNAGPKIADNNLIEPKETLSEPVEETQNDQTDDSQKQEEAMPVETIENNAGQVNLEEEENSANTVIPAIEKSLDASVLVSNLKVDWEVPEGYATNVAAKRYLTKLGKIIQLNLKTELLLLQKPPLSNKISVEIKYNPISRRFETVGVKDSSGEKTVDALVISTVNGILKTSVTYNLDFISNIPGNPVLIIHL